jgi:hypothetical protein
VSVAQVVECLYEALSVNPNTVFMLECSSSSRPALHLLRKHESLSSNPNLTKKKKKLLTET